MPILAFMFARAAMDIPFPKDDILFVPDIVYRFGILDEVVASAAYAGHPTIGYLACEKLLKEGRVPENELPRIHKNFEEYTKLIEKLVADKKIESPIKNTSSIVEKYKYKKRK
jgi:hypothetical protein